MKHAIVTAHPNVRSLTHAAGQTYADAAQSLGHQVVWRDLYAIDFDPRLRAEEIPTLSPPSPAPDVVEERRLLADVEVFAFIYPLWFNAPPAILKGYVDRVFSMGFGYKPGFGGTEPALVGRRLISFSFSGAPDDWVRDTGALTALVTLFDRHIAAMCGLQVIDHLHNGGITHNLRDDVVTDILASIRQAVLDAFQDDHGA